MDTTPAPKTKRRSTYVTLPKFLQQSNTALTNALLPAILPLLIKRGYTEAQLQAKIAELDNLQKLDELQKKEYGEQYNATTDYHDLEDSLHEDYIDHLDLARMVFENMQAAQTTLGLKGKRNVSASGYCTQALLFYNNALGNATYMAELANKGIDAAELAHMQTEFGKLKDLAAAQTKESGEAQTATANRDAAHEAINNWMAEFKKTAIIALRKSPQLREQLGYLEA